MNIGVLRRTSLATALTVAVGATVLATASPAQAGPGPTCGWIDCPPPQELVTSKIKWPPGPVCLSCPFELRNLYEVLVLPQTPVVATEVLRPGA